MVSEIFSVLMELSFSLLLKSGVFGLICLGVMVFRLRFLMIRVVSLCCVVVCFVMFVFVF